jgi:hypothetical protein
MNSHDLNIDTIKDAVRGIEEYLWISVKHRHAVGINRVLFTLIEVYRSLSSGLTTNLYLKDKDEFNLRLQGMKLMIGCYGRLGGILIDEKVEEGFHTYIEFITDVIGQLNFELPESEQDVSKALLIWNELQEIEKQLTESKLKTLFQVCAKAIDKKIYSLVYSFVKEMTSEHPRVININKKQLFRILEEDRLERFWIDTISVTGINSMNVFGLLGRPINAISRCYLILRSYSIFKCVAMDTLMSFPIPEDKNKKRDLYYLIDSLKMNKSFLDEAYNDLLLDKSAWEELFKGKFAVYLEKTWLLINERFSDLDQKQKEIETSLPLDEEKVRGFKQTLTDSFQKFRCGNSWIDYQFQKFLKDMEIRKSYKRAAGKMPIPRDMFVYGLNIIGDLVARDFGNKLAQDEISIIMNFVRGIAEKKDVESILSQESLLGAMVETLFGSQFLAIIASSENRIGISKWPVFRGQILNSETNFPLTFKGTEYSCRFFFYYPAIASNEIIVMPLSALKVESEEVPLVEINERFRFSDYEGDTSEKVEFIMDLIMKSIVLKEDLKAVVITFSTSPKR